MGGLSGVGRIFLYFPILMLKTINCYNFRINDANDSIFTPQLRIDNGNISCDFGENIQHDDVIVSHVTFFAKMR